MKGTTIRWRRWRREARFPVPPMRARAHLSDIPEARHPAPPTPPDGIGKHTASLVVAPPSRGGKDPCTRKQGRSCRASASPASGHPTETFSRSTETFSGGAGREATSAQAWPTGPKPSGWLKAADLPVLATKSGNKCWEFRRLYRRQRFCGFARTVRRSVVPPTRDLDVSHIVHAKRGVFYACLLLKMMARRSRTGPQCDAGRAGTRPCRSFLTPAFPTLGEGAGGRTRVQTSRLADRIMMARRSPDRTAMRRRAVLVRVLAARSRPVIPLGRERTAERGHRHPASLKAWRRALQLAPETFGRVTQEPRARAARRAAREFGFDSSQARATPNHVRGSCSPSYSGWLV